MSENLFPSFVLKGRAHEIGYQYREKCRELIHKNVELYLKISEHYAHLKPSQTLSLSKGFIPYIEGFDPSMMEEMRGIAEGVQCRLEEVVALNVRTELMFPHRLGIQECTAIGMSEGPILCQNWDWIPSFKDTTVILHIEQEGKPSITMMTEAGYKMDSINPTWFFFPSEATLPWTRMKPLMLANSFALIM